ncbi:MAG: acetyl-CoA carboxylase biotin carboxylase subunit [Amoebophilaceae bacterium TMED152]|nr:acetyl-CoA carboxylase biotin carboxylase subunit [Gammaproteobacteria bacterium]RPH02014.1 MAG: acetyl-CoA carboxylase biotin carboxylase subunit [Amoebophilaceae bacterium TMED152]
MKETKKILIANRGVIAIRALRAAKELGYKVASVYSTVDRDQKHLKLSDEAICIGPGPARDSYLNEAAIIAAAELANVDAIYPGYGFLAENASFAEKCNQSGFKFIGPDPKVIEIMGDKIKAKELVVSLGIPIVPGYSGDIQSNEQIRPIVREIGYPVIVKATSGGGGKGMRIVNNENELWDSIVSAQNEAKLAFGNDKVFIEKFLGKPRHIEIQIFGDGKGKAIHLYSRDCSLQRKYQKILEEAPALNIPREKLDEIQNICVKACEEISYEGAGTLEFLYEDGQFFFIEMNTRIQVEHTVTEMITGIDLVQSQLILALEGQFKMEQDDIKVNGHAMQCRINAEDPETFIPSPGVIENVHRPGGYHVRFESQIYSGYKVPTNYDSLIAEVIVKDRDRDKTINKMEMALNELVISGIKTNKELHLRILEDSKFKNVDYYIKYLEEELI